MKRIRIVATTMLLVACLFVFPIQAMEAAKSTNVVSHTIEYYGGGTKPTTVSGQTVYHSGNIIKLTVILPANTHSVGIGEVIKYDTNLLELQDSFADISRTIDPKLAQNGWTNTVLRYDNDVSQIWLDSTASSPADGQNTSGGVVATMKFKIRNVKESDDGVSINFGFNNFAMVGFENGRSYYMHAGYDKNDPSTDTINLPSKSIVAGKKEVIVDPGTNKPGIPEPGNPNKPVEYNPVVLDPEKKEEIINKLPEKTVAEIAETVKKVNYSFTLDKNKSIAGRNGYDSQVELVNGNIAKLKKDDNYKVYSFTSSKKNKVVNKTPVDNTCYTHWILLSISAFLILGTVLYTKYENQRAFAGGKEI